MFLKDEIIELAGMDPKMPTKRWDFNMDLIITKWILPIIGKAIYDDLTLKKSLNTLTPEEQWIVTTLGYAIAWYIQAHYIADNINIAAAGTAQRSYGGDEWSTIPSPNTSGNFRDYYETNGNSYLERVREWMLETVKEPTGPIQHGSMFIIRTNKPYDC